MDILSLTAQAKPATTQRGQDFIAKVLEESPLLRWLMNFKLGATEHQYRPAVGGQTLSGRAINGVYTPANLDPATLQSGELALMGFYLKWDQTYQRDLDLGIGIEMNAWFDDELEERQIDTADELEKLIIAGDGQNDLMEGIATILDGTNVPGLGISMVVNAETATGGSGDSFDLTTSNNYNKFLELLEKIKKEVRGAQGLICNDSMGARLATIARHFHMYSMRVDQFGKPVEQINGLDIITVSDTVITNTEDDDADPAVGETTSIYVVANRTGHWNIRSNSGLAFFDYGELDGEMKQGIAFEVTAKNEIKRKAALRRIRNIKI